jgi:hypothetical protein
LSKRVLASLSSNRRRRKVAVWLRAVVMNGDATRGVSAELSIGAELDSMLWIGLGLLGVGVLFAVGSGLAITAGVRHRRKA